MEEEGEIRAISWENNNGEMIAGELARLFRGVVMTAIYVTSVTN